MNRAFAFIQLLESGQAAGSLELVKTPVAEAHAYATKVMAQNGRKLEEEIPEFSAHYVWVQKLATLGRTQRKDMPVINDEQVRNFQRRLATGLIDVAAPFAPETNEDNPFPEGLSGEQAAHFLHNGAPKFDKADPSDDKVPVSRLQIEVGDLKPIQQQIYFSKCIGPTAQHGAAATRKFLSTSNFVTSADHYILDGHHRWLSANLLDPKMVVGGISIDLPIAELLPLATAYGDAIGNKRNA